MLEKGKRGASKTATLVFTFKPPKLLKRKLVFQRGSFLYYRNTRLSILRRSECKEEHKASPLLNRCPNISSNSIDSYDLREILMSLRVHKALPQGQDHNCW